MNYIKKTSVILILIILFNNNFVYATVFSYKSKNLDSIDEEYVLERLRISKAYHVLKFFDSAIDGYDSILISSAPQYIKNETLIYRKLAEAKKNISIKYVYRPSFIEIVSKSREDYRLKRYSATLNHYYSPFEDYFDLGKTTYKKCDDLDFDTNKIPMTKYNGKFYYNPVTIAQYALSLYGKYLEGDNTKNEFLDCANFLVDFMDERGSLRYNFIYNHYEELPLGWTSSMAQGQALSVFERAFYITGDNKYLYAGNKALQYLITPITQGGVMDTLETLDVNLKDKIFFQEYVNTSSSYTLNGYIFTLIGLYDWSQIKVNDNKYYSNIANQYFYKGIESLKCILPYYDIGGFTSYDLYYITKNVEPNSAGKYHAIHLEQLDILYYITKDNYFKDMRDLWSSYVT